MNAGRINDIRVGHPIVDERKHELIGHSVIVLVWARRCRTKLKTTKKSVKLRDAPDGS